MLFNILDFELKYTLTINGYHIETRKPQLYVERLVNKKN